MTFARSGFGSRKWRFLELQAEFDRCTVPVYMTSAGGHQFPLLKTLLSNFCINSCRYCNIGCRKSALRERWEVDELVKATRHLFESGHIKGLFLSSTLDGDSDRVVEKEIEVAEKLRQQGLKDFYIHLKLMPGVSRDLVRRAALVASRIGVNLEAPRKDVFDEICPDKDYKDGVLKRLEWCASEERWLRRQAIEKRFLSSGIDTQIIVGAEYETDLDHLKITDWLYQKLGLRRIYFSRFDPVPDTPLENREPCSRWREYRLYQASFLLRDYGFKLNDLKDVLDDQDFLPNRNPKLVYAKLHEDIFPINLNTANRQDILKIPLIGPKATREIVEKRKIRPIKNMSDLKRIVGSYRVRRVAPYVDLNQKKISDFFSG
ncbi:MAG: radical SAM protein [Promethearchaeota archaeon]